MAIPQGSRRSDESGSAAALAAAERISREPSTRILATMIRYCGGDFQLAEDAFQEAMAAALVHWPISGVPREPAAWILTTARRKAVDQIRRDRTMERTRDALGRALVVERDRDAPADDAADGPEEANEDWNDDQLRLIFTCCHPALAVEAQVALTLRVVARLETPEIARALLVSESTMAQRIVRAKRKIRDAGIPYVVPPPTSLETRLAGVLAVVYLIFNEGYAATAGDVLLRPELSSEAIRLGCLLNELLPGEPEVMGLLSLMLLHDSRRAARIDDHGDLVTLEDQNRSLWDHAQIGEGVALVETALRQRKPGPFQIQAAIAAVHAESATAAETDWRQIALLYRELARYQLTPVVALNRAAAVAMATDWNTGLALLDEIELHGTLTNYHLFHASRADLLRRAGRLEGAAGAYRRALAHCQNDVERRYLARRLAEVEAAATISPGGTS